MHPMLVVYVNHANDTHDEINNRAQNSEKHDIGKVLEESPALHIVPSREYDGRQDKVEKEVFIELHTISQDSFRKEPSRYTQYNRYSRWVKKLHLPRNTFSLGR